MKMKASTLLMAAVLLVAAAAAPLNNLNVVFDEIPKVNQTFMQKYFVEDLTLLAEGVNKCGDAFFCKVYDILVHKNFSKLVDDDDKEEEEQQKKPEKHEALEKIVRNLNRYHQQLNVNCSLVLEGVRTSNVSTRLTQFWNKVTFCIQERNLRG